MNSVAAVQARIAEIQGRFAAPGSAAPGFAAAMARVPTGAGGVVGAAALANGAVPNPEYILSAPATGAPTGTVLAAPLRGGASSDVATGSGVAAGWARRLPAAGQRWAGAIADAARAEGVDPRLLAALVRAESGFNAGARSHAGAIGLAQLMPATAAGLGVDPTDPLANLRGGARYLRQQLDRFGSPELALAAYNAGPGRVAQAGGIPQISETQNYVFKVMGYYRDLGGSA